MLLVPKLANSKWCKKSENDWNPAKGYLYESTRGELSNAYEHERALMVFKDFASLCFGRK